MQVPCPQQACIFQKMIRTGFSLINPGCRIRLYRRIASEISYVGMCHAGDKAQCFLVKRPHTLDGVLDFIERVDVFQEFPTAVVPVFKDLLNYVAPIFISRKVCPVGIPEQVLRKFAEIYVRTAHHEKYTKFKGNNPKSQLKGAPKSDLLVGYH